MRVSRQHILGWAVFLMLFGGSLHAHDLDVELCQFPVPESIERANTSFHLVYTFEVDEEGVPFAITKVRGKAVDDADVEACLQGWRLLGFEEPTGLSASFYWRHGFGWENLIVVGPGLSYKVRLSGSRPYRCAAEEVEEG